MSDQHQFNIFEGERPKEMTWRNDSAWMEHALKLADKHLPHGEVMGQDLQNIVGIGKPSSQHSWGRMISRAKRRGILQETGKFKKSTRRSNKSHTYAIYWREGYPQSS